MIIRLSQEIHPDEPVYHARLLPPFLTPCCLGGAGDQAAEPLAV